MKINLSSIKRRLAQTDKRAVRLASAEIAELVAEIERLTVLAEAADAWAQAIAVPDGVQATEQALLDAVKAWKQGERAER